MARIEKAMAAATIRTLRSALRLPLPTCRRPSPLYRYFNLRYSSSQNPGPVSRDSDCHRRAVLRFPRLDTMLVPCLAA